MMKLITRILSNIVALYLAHLWVAGFIVRGGWKEYLIAGGTLGILNLIVKPILKTISFPLMIITLGLFTLVINAFLLWGVSHVFPNIISISSLASLAWATLLMTVVNLLISHSS